jgi:uncharacterized 2Fe-2S/4Fe-4S cluster protein (DUF4445 family)
VDLVNICGGAGVCRRCKIQIVAGEVTGLTSQDQTTFSESEIAQNYRLACRCFPRSDVKVHIPPESLTAPQRTQVEGLTLSVAPDPCVRCLDVQLPAPTFGAAVSDDQNLWAALAGKYDIAEGFIDLKVQQDLSPAFRSANWQVQVGMRGSEMVWLGNPSTRLLGLAVDIGTTKIAAYLVDMESGRTLSSQGLMNPQISYGEDIISRIAFAGKSKENARKMQSLLVDALNASIVSMCAEQQSDPSNVVDAVLVGNTAIHHLFLMLPVAQLGVAPYVPAVRAAVDVKARDLGLNIAPGAYIHMLPNVAGYVGADHVAMLLASGIAESRQTVLAVDIGTNTELCLNHGGRMTSVSCASGPAFEGAHIRFGMRAAPGAIEHVRLWGEKLDVQTIGLEPAVGICGSGLLDAVAQMRVNNILDSSGRMHPHPRVRQQGRTREFVLVERAGKDPITVSQQDVRELQMAKAAIRAGIRALVEAEGQTEESIDQVILAGAFGTYLDIESAIEIGMLPPLPPDRYRQVGNAAGTGARLALISRSQRLQAEQIALQDGYIELGTIKNFNRKFAEASSMSRSLPQIRKG